MLWVHSEDGRRPASAGSHFDHHRAFVHCTLDNPTLSSDALNEFCRAQLAQWQLRGPAWKFQDQCSFQQSYLQKIDFLRPQPI
jgi:hypothetical protein